MTILRCCDESKKECERRGNVPVIEMRLIPTDGGWASIMRGRGGRSYRHWDLMEYLYIWLVFRAL